MAASPNLIPRIGLALSVGFFLYTWMLVTRNGGPVSDLSVVGWVMLYAMLFATFATMFIAAARANRAGSWLWFFGVILIWPLSYLYTLVVNRRG